MTTHAAILEQLEKYEDHKVATKALTQIEGEKK